MAGSIARRVLDTGKKVARVVKDSMGMHTDRVDYSTKDSREATVSYLYEQAKMQRQEWVNRAQMHDRYYNGQHDTVAQIAKSCETSGIPWIPAMVTDPYTHVEAMIIPDLPDFEFSGRDTDMDSSKAKQRQYVVKYVLERNRVADMVPAQERRINKGGIAFYKVFFDASIPAPYSTDGGEIVVVDIDGACIFPDPNAVDIKDCEYIVYSYPMATRKAARVFREELKSIKRTIWEMGIRGDATDTKIYESGKPSLMIDEMVQIIEHWYLDDEGEVACSIQINGEEIKHIERYWQATGGVNKRFPFVSIQKISDENNFWGRSILEPIIPTVDAADREMAFGLINDAFMANDIVLEEENVWADGQQPPNQPGARWKVKDGKINNVRRLGGVTSFGQRGQAITFLQDQISRTIGNYDSTMGKEPTRVTTASGIAQLNERADARKNIQQKDRLNGYELLYELIDWTALEFYDDNRVIFIGATDKRVTQIHVDRIQQAQAGGIPAEQAVYNMDPKQGSIVFRFNTQKMKVKGTSSGGEDYYPRVDCVIRAGDGVRNSKAFSLAFLEKLIGVPITPFNYKIVQAMIRMADIPDREEICDFLEEVVGQQRQQMEAQAQAQEAAQQQAVQQQQSQQAQDAGFRQQELDIMRQQFNPAVQNGESPAEGGEQQPIDEDLPPEIDAILQNMQPNELQMLMDNPQLLQEFVKAVMSLPPEQIQELINNPEIVEQLLIEIANGGLPQQSIADRQI
jgi:hypothetical protein